MAVPNNKSDDALLKNLVPLNTLSEEQLGQLLSRIVIEKARKGKYLFREGDSDHQNIYLLTGTVALLSGHKEVDLVSSGTQTARFALAHQLPRKHSVRAKSQVTYVRIDSRMLSNMLARSQTASYEVNEADSAGKNDWMSLLLHLPVFQQIPPANLQRVMMKMIQVTVSADETIIQQGDDGDYFYLISRGGCRVTRQPAADRPPVELAQLKAGQGFGEESLISNKPRSSTVTMITDGELVRLSKQDFVELVKQPLSSSIDYPDACRMIEQDAIWVDVRAPEEYDAGHLPDAINLPFFSLRFQASSLATDRVYLIYGVEVGQAATAAYLLVEQGYETFVLSEDWSDIATQAGLDSPVFESQVDNVIDFNRDADSSQEGEGQQAALASEKHVNAVEDLRKQLTDARSKFEEKLVQYQTEQKVLKQALNVAKRKLQVHEKDSDKASESLNKKIEQLQAALAAGEKLQQQAAEDFAALEKQRGVLQQELEESKTASGAHEKQAKDEIAAIKQELEGSLTELQQLEVDKGSLHEERDRMQMELADLQTKSAQQLERVVSDHNSLEQANQKLRGECTALEEELVILRQSSDASGTEYQGLIDNLRADLDQAQYNSGFLKRSLATAEDAIEITENVLNEQDEENAALKAQLPGLQAQVEELESDKAELERCLTEMRGKQEDRDRLALEAEQAQRETLEKFDKELTAVRAELEKSHAEEIEREAGRKIGLEALQVEKTEIEVQLAETQSRLQTKEQGFDAATAEQQQRIDQMEHDLSAAKSEIERLTQAKEGAQDSQKYLEDAKQEISRLNKTVDGLREVQLEMETQLSDDSDEEILKLRAALEQEEKKRRNAEEQAKQTDVLRREREVQETAVEMLGEDLDSLEREKRKLEDDNKVLERQLSELHGQKSDSNMADNLLVQLDEMRVNAKSFEQQRDEARSESARMKREVHELRSVMETYVEQLQHVHSSGENDESTALRSELDMVRRQAAEDLEQMRKEFTTAKAQVKQDGRDINEAASMQALRQETDSTRQALHDKDHMLQLSQTQCRTLEDAIEDRDREVDQLKRKLELLIRKASGLGEFSDLLGSERRASQKQPSEITEQLSDLQELRVHGQPTTENDKKGSKLGRLFRKK